MFKYLARIALIVGALCLTPLLSSTASAKGVYQSGPDFFAQVFAGREATSKTLWITDPIREQAQRILGHPLNLLRVRYQELDGTTAWILEEIGKEMPISIGVVIENDAIKTVKILAYRESRGGEVRFPSFMAQCRGATLDAEGKLDRSIDGITGATLSVWAVNRVAALALYYHSQAITP